MKYFLILASLFLGACTFQKQAFTEETPVWKRSFDSSSLDLPLHANRMTKEFYRSNNFRFVWLDSSGLRPVGDSMITVIKDAERYGLFPSDYHYDELAEFADSSKAASELPAKVEVYLTDAFFTMCLHLKSGRINKKTFQLFDPTDSMSENALESLSEVAAGGFIAQQLKRYEPSVSLYKMLKDAMQQHLAVRSTDSTFIKKYYQLIANLERWRQQKPLPWRHLAVNVPSFMLEIVEDDTVVFESKVIVGKPETPTPELESVIKSFIIYPYWHVPRSIVKEILPAIQADSLYFRRHNYQVLDHAGTMIDATALDWSSFTEENFPYVLRQREGSENTMGVLKFVFANNYNVYLHDTNAKRLFSRDDRALSHGCIRVNKAVQLAHYLAKDDDTYVSPEDLDQYLLLQHRMEVQVVKPLPLYLQYFTVGEDNGNVIFYNDLYKKDKKMFEALTHQVSEENL